MKRLANILLGVLLVVGQPALTSTLAGPAADDAAAGSGCSCGRSCCVNRSDDPTPRAPFQVPTSSARADSHGTVCPSSPWFLLPPLVDDSPLVGLGGLVSPVLPVPIYDRDCSYLI